MTRFSRNLPDPAATPADGRVPHPIFEGFGRDSGVAGRAEPDPGPFHTMLVAFATIASTLTAGNPFVLVKRGDAAATAVFPRSSTESLVPQRVIAFSLERQAALAENLGRGEHVVVGGQPARDPDSKGRSECVVLFPIVHGPEAVFLLCVALEAGQELAAREVKLLQILCRLAAPLVSEGEIAPDVRRKSLDEACAQLESKTASLEKKIRSLERAKRDVEAIDHQMRSLLLSNIAHELRTPLVAIRGYTRMILEGRAGELNSTQREYLSVVDENVGRLVALTENLSRLTATQQLRTEPFDLCALLRECVAAIVDPCAQKGIQLAAQLPSGRFELMGDREKLAQVLTALLANAIRYTDGGGNIRVEFHRGKQGEATIKVMDSGAGIPRELADKLFDAAASGGPRIEGPNSIGHGLSLVHDIVYLHGGRISVNSKMGKGSTFAITLPALKAHAGRVVRP